MTPDERANLRFFRTSLLVLILAMLALIGVALGWVALVCTVFTGFMACVFTLVDHMLGEDRKERRHERLPNA